MSEHHSKYEDHIVHHDPQEGFDPTEPDAKSITMFVIVSVVTLIVVMVALQGYFQKIWNELTYERVLSVPGEELAAQHNLENWRLTHYEYTDKSKSTVRIPLERAKELFLKEAAEGKAFYPGKPTEPKPETPGGTQQAAAGAPGLPGAAPASAAAPAAAGAAPAVTGAKK
jgi:hypothetical protein